MRRFLIILLMLISIPTYAYADIVGVHDRVRKSSSDVIQVHFKFHVTDNNDMYILHGLKYHLIVKDTETNEKIFEYDYKAYFKELNGTPLLVFSQHPAGFETGIKQPILKNHDNITTTVTDLVPIAEYVPDYERARIMRGAHIY